MYGRTGNIIGGCVVFDAYAARGKEMIPGGSVKMMFK